MTANAPQLPDRVSRAGRPTSVCATKAAEELARAIVDRLHHAEPSVDADQFALPI